MASFDQTLEFGQAGESEIALWLRQRGNTVLPAYEKLFDTGKGPRLFTPTRQLISPDFLVWRGDRCSWIEAKHKTAFAWFRKKQRFVTGIDLRHYQDYLALDDESPWPVWLLFLHDGGQAKDSPKSPRGLFGNSLAHLRTHEIHRWGEGTKGGMVYWAIEELKDFTQLNQKLLQPLTADA